MKKLIYFGMFLCCVGLTGAGFAQTAAQYLEAGNQTYAAKDYAKAVQYYQAAAQLDPNSAAAYQGLGNSQYSQGQDSAALASYEKALALNPNNAQLSTFVQSLRAKVGAAPAGSTAVPAPATGAAASPAAGSSSGKLEMDLSGGLALGSGTTGFGGALGVFAPLGGDFSVGGQVSYFTFSSGASGGGNSVSASDNFLEVLVLGKYRFGGTGFRPYLLGGAGMAMVMESVTVGSASISASQMDPMIGLGGGAEFSAGPGMNIFVQGLYSMVLVTGGSSSYEPIEAGVNFNL